MAMSRKRGASCAEVCTSFVVVVVVVMGIVTSTLPNSSSLLNTRGGVSVVGVAEADAPPRWIQGHDEAREIGPPGRLSSVVVVDSTVRGGPTRAHDLPLLFLSKALVKIVVDSSTAATAFLVNHPIVDLWCGVNVSGWWCVSAKGRDTEMANPKGYPRRAWKAMTG
jgi:hypothetical protein